MYVKKCAGKKMHHCTIRISCKDPLGNEMMYFKGLILIKTSQPSQKSKKKNKPKQNILLWLLLSSFLTNWQHCKCVVFCWGDTNPAGTSAPLSFLYWKLVLVWYETANRHRCLLTSWLCPLHVISGICWRPAAVGSELSCSWSLVSFCQGQQKTDMPTCTHQPGNTHVHICRFRLIFSTFQSLMLEMSSSLVPAGQLLPAHWLTAVSPATSLMWPRYRNRREEQQQPLGAVTHPPPKPHNPSLLPLNSDFRTEPPRPVKLAQSLLFFSRWVSYQKGLWRAGSFSCCCRCRWQLGL